MALAKERPLTADDLLRLDGEGFRGELIRGALPGFSCPVRALFDL